MRSSVRQQIYVIPYFLNGRSNRLRSMLLALAVCMPGAALYGQNMVPNGSFEAINACPTGLSQIAFSPNYTQFPTVKDWVRPTWATSDYFNACAANPVVSVPGNAFGYQPARSGQGYAGIWAYQKILLTNEYREFISTKLSRRMVKDSAYCVTFHVSPGFDSTRWNITINEIGAAFSDTLPTQPQSTPVPLPLSYGIFNDSTRKLTDTTIWHEIKGVYVAKSNEAWMSIGCFGAAPPSYTVLGGRTSSPNSPTGYMYIDDVSVVPAPRFDSMHARLICDTTMILTSSRHSGPYTWSTGATTRSITVSQAGTYICMSFDDCAAYSDRFEIMPATQYDSVHQAIMMCNTNDTGILLTSTHPSGPYTWNTGARTRTIRVWQAGDYTCTASGCEILRDLFHVDMVNVTPPDAFDTTICQHVPMPDLHIADTGLLWYTSTDSTAQRAQPSIATNLPYVITLFVARQAGICFSKKVPFTVTIKGYPRAHPAETVFACNDGAQRFVVIGKDPEVDAAYVWSSGESVCCIRPQKDGMYIREATNTCGSTTDTVIIWSRECDSCIFLPNAFSPNNDGHNDGFSAMSNCPVKDFQMRIYNRWGEQVFFSEHLGGQWDGTYKGQPAAAATYMYYVRFRTVLSDKQYITKGNVTLIR